jgi:hypothetical protein
MIIAGVAGWTSEAMGKGENLSYSAMGWFILAATPLCVGIALWKAPEPPAPKDLHPASWGDYVGLFRNAAVRLIVGVDLLIGLGLGVVATLFFFYFERVKDITNYIVKGVLWQAFEADRPVVLLIDEIDKADIEFPNDLLREIDRMEFYCYETRQLIKAKHRPVVMITSNNEKELPDAFLRRCFFHYIKFPDKETMQKIVDVHHPGIKKQLLAEAMESFFQIRELPGIKKKPSTSELLDWLKLLVAEDIPAEALQSKDGKAAIPPLHGALLKNEQDIHLFERLIFMARHNR